MKKGDIDLFGEIFETKHKYNKEILEKHIEKLRELDEYLPPMQSFFIVTNTATQTYEFVSSNFNKTLGLDIDKMKTKGVAYWFSHFHPNDLPVWLKALEDLMIFTMTKIPLSERVNLTYSWNYRIMNSSGNYLNILDHQTPTYFDADGKPIIGISHCNVIGEGENRPIIGSIKKLNKENEYETIFRKNYSQNLISQSLSNREQDVMRLLALNKTSKEIASKLFISHHTVDGHRRNILQKLDFSSTAELVNYCLSNQLF